MRHVYSSLGRRRTRDVEPLVDAGIDGTGCLVLALGNVERAGLSALGGVRDGGVDPGHISYIHWSKWCVNIQAEVLLGRLASGKLLPGLGALADNVHGVLLVLALAGEGELVLGLAVWDLVDAEPLICGTEKAGQMALDVLDIVELRGQRVIHVDDHDLPVGLALVKQGHDTEDLDLDDLAGLVHKLADLANVQWVVVALCLGLLVCDIGVLPCLQQQSVLRFGY
jgi:hypothetical protein